MHTCMLHVIMQYQFVNPTASKPKEKDSAHIPDSRIDVQDESNRRTTKRPKMKKFLKKIKQNKRNRRRMIKKPFRKPLIPVDKKGILSTI